LLQISQFLFKCNLPNDTLAVVELALLGPSNPEMYLHLFRLGIGCDKAVWATGDPMWTEYVAWVR